MATIKENVNTIVENYNKIKNEDYKYELFIKTTSIMKILGIKTKTNVKAMLKKMDNGNFKMPAEKDWFGEDGEGHIEVNGTKYGYRTCNALRSEYNAFSTRYEASISELKKRIEGLENFSYIAKTYFDNANKNLEKAKQGANNLIFQDKKSVKEDIDDCIKFCDSTVEKLDYIIKTI